MLLPIDKSTVHPEMSASIRRFHFYTWWKHSGDRQELFKMVNQVRQACGLPVYTWDIFDEGWQYRTVLHESYKVARDEMFNLCFGWW